MKHDQYVENVYDEERRLIQQAEREKRLVFFIGAGASIASGMPSWKAAIDQIKRRMNVAPQDDFLKIPQYYYIQHGKREYTRLMRDVFKHQKNLPTNAIHSEIFKFRVSTIVTTNYDHLLEKAAQSAYRVVDVISQDSDLTYGFAENKIIKMHGSFEHDNFVLKEEDYLNYERNFRLLTAYIKSLIATNTLVFVGYSFNDPDLKQIFSWVGDVLGRDMPRSYMIVADRPYSEVEVNYFRDFGIELIYASRKLANYGSLEIKARIVEMLKFLKEEEKVDKLDKIYQFLIPFQNINYVHSKYIKKALSLGNIRSDGNRFRICDQSDVHEKDFFAYIQEVAGDTPAQFLASKKLTEQDTKKYKIIYEILLKSNVYFSAVSRKINQELRVPDNTVRLKQQMSTVSGKITHAVMNYDRSRLKVLKSENEGCLSDQEPMRYLEQAAIAYHLGEYTEAYRYLRQVSGLFYQQEQYVWYFISQMNRKYLAERIRQGIAPLYKVDEEGLRKKEEEERIEKEAQEINLDHIFYRLPDLGAEQNSFLRELYTIQIFYAAFLSAHKASEKAQIEANTNYIIYAGTPEIQHLSQQIMDNWLYVTQNYIFCDSYDEVADTFRLYAQTLLTTLIIPEASPGGDFCFRMGSGNIKISELNGDDMFFILRYLPEKNMEQILAHGDVGCIRLDDSAKEGLLSILENMNELYWAHRNEIVNKILILLYYTPLTPDFVTGILVEITHRISKFDFHSRLSKIANLFVQIDRQKNSLAEKQEEISSLLHIFIQSILKSVIDQRIPENWIYNILGNGLSLHQKMTRKKFSSDYLSELMQEKYLYTLNILYPYVKKEVRGRICRLAKEKVWEWDVPNIGLFCLLLQSKILKSNKKLEDELLAFAHDMKDDRANKFPSQYEQVVAYLSNVSLKECFIQNDKVRVFIQSTKVLFYVWLSDRECFDYTKFDTKWLAYCSDNLLKDIGENPQVRKKIQEAMKKQYLEGHIDVDSVKRYFEFFAVS